MSRLFRGIFTPKTFRPEPPSGDEPYLRSTEVQCDDSELMLYIGELLFASNPTADDGLLWTRKAVNSIEVSIQQIKDGSGADRSAMTKCVQCLNMGITNWQEMLSVVQINSQRAPQTGLFSWFSKSKAPSEDTDAILATDAVRLADLDKIMQKEQFELDLIKHENAQPLTPIGNDT